MKYTENIFPLRHALYVITPITIHWLGDDSTMDSNVIVNTEDNNYNLHIRIDILPTQILFRLINVFTPRL